MDSFPRIEADNGNLGPGGCSETLLWIVVMGSTVNLIAFGKRVLFAFLSFLLAFLSAAVTSLTHAARMIPPSRIPVRGSGLVRCLPEMDMFLDRRHKCFQIMRVVPCHVLLLS